MIRGIGDIVDQGISVLVNFILFKIEM